MTSAQPSLVVDSCVAVAWSLSDERGEFAMSVEGAIRREGMVIPVHWHAEVASALLRKERSGEFDSEITRLLTSGMERLKVVVDSEGIRRTYHDTLALARKHRLSIYDAMYLEVAVRRGLRLATLDRPLYLAAEAEGVALLDIAA